MVFSLKDLLYELINARRSEAEKKGLWLYYEGTTHLPEKVRADAGKLRQVLFNLLDNAIQNTQTGGVNLHLSQSGYGIEGSLGSEMDAYLPPTARISFKIQDTGPGIEREKIEQLTSTCSRNEIEARIKSGEGVGIPIAVRLVKLMGGKLSIVSTPGEGTIVTVELELEVAPTVDQTTAAADTVAPVKSGHSPVFTVPLAGMVMLFIVSGLLFSWPFLGVPALQQPHYLFVYLFSAWAFVIVLIYLLHRNRPPGGFRRKHKSRDT